MKTQLFLRTVVALACSASLVLASCGGQSQPEVNAVAPGRNTPPPGAKTTAPAGSTKPSVQIASLTLSQLTPQLQEYVAYGSVAYLLFGVNVPNVVQWLDHSQQFFALVADAKAAFSTIGAVVGAVKSVQMILQFLGILAPATDEVFVLEQDMLANDEALTIQATYDEVDTDYRTLSLPGIQGAYEAGSVSLADNNDTLTKQGLDGLLGGSAWSRAVDNSSGDDAATDGVTMYAPFSTGTTVSAPNTPELIQPNGFTWKQVIEHGSYIAPNVGGSPAPKQTFEWRLAAPFLLKALADRLLVMGMIDPNFMTDGFFNASELGPDYGLLKQLYDQMNNGVQCGSEDYVFIPSALASQDVYGCAIVCADIYTGFAVLSAIDPKLPYNPKTGSSTTCATAQQTTAYADVVNNTAAAVRQEMPLFEMKAALDNLYRILNPNPAENLTTLDNMIAPMTQADVCISGLNGLGLLAAGNTLQTSICDQTDPSQGWSFNPVTGQISNLTNPNLCIEMDGTTTGVPATIQTCATPHPTMDSPAAGNLEIDNVNQKWTYNVGTTNLINGSGNLVNGSGLSLGWKATQNVSTTTPGPSINVVSNVWGQGSGWIDPSWDGTMQLGGANLMWRSDSPAFTWPQDLGSASELASPPAVAANGDYSQATDVFWLDSSNHLRWVENNTSQGWVVNPATPLDLGPDPAPPGNLAATSWAPGRLDLVQLGANRGGCQLWHYWYSNGAWQWWESLAYLQNQPALNCSYGPAISSWGTSPGDRLDIFAINQQTGGVGHVAFDRSIGGWQPWEDLGVPTVYGVSGYATSAPAAVSWGPGRIDLIVRGADFNIYYNTYLSGYGWSGWENKGGNLAGGAWPTITAPWPNRLDIFGVSSNFHLNHLIWDGAWAPEGWSDMGYTVPGSVSAVATASDFIDIFARESNGALWEDRAP